MMYSVAVRRNFIANHFLTGGDWGPENECHAHHYVVETRFDGTELDHHGYLVDICEVEAALDALVEDYRDKTLNRLAVFEGLNPSLEHFARIIWQAVSDQLQASNIKSMTVRVWENDIAWAAYRKNL
jgi:6-pyruvoyltetrahydropterin/6-carboxytetrahydropterin synthase